MLGPFRQEPVPGGQMSPADMKTLMELAYKFANATGSGPIHVSIGPGGLHIWLDSELPDVSYLNVQDKMVFSGNNCTLVHTVRVVALTLPEYTRSENTLTGIDDSISSTYTDDVTLDEDDDEIDRRFLLNRTGGHIDNGVYLLADPLNPTDDPLSFAGFIDDGSSGANSVLDNGSVTTAAAMDVTGLWQAVRTVDACTSNMVRAGFLVQTGPEGTDWPSVLWQLLTENEITLNTDALNWQPYGLGKVRGTLDDDLTSGGSTTMTKTEGGATLTVYSLFTAAGTIASGTIVTAFFESMKWWIDSADCA